MITEVLECRERSKICCSQCMMLFATVFSDFDCYKFAVREAHFWAESIGASPVIIACKLGKLFKFFTRLLRVNVL